jgi:hypothetical protein
MRTESDKRGGGRIAGWTAAAVVAVLGFLPLVQWVRGTVDYDGFPNLLARWVSGTGIVLGIAIVLAILARRITALWPAAQAARIGALVEREPARFVAILTVVACIAYVAAALLVFGGRPLLIDEVAQFRQAEIFASGHLWLPTPEPREFFSSLLMVDANGRTFSQFPPGGPAMMAPLTVLGVPWLTGPLFGAASVIAFAWLLRAIEPDARTRAGAVALFALAPFVVFMSGSYMNCVPTLTWLLVAAGALTHGLQADRPRPALAAVAGFAFGVAATIRPVDALAFAAPAAVWYLARAWRDPARWRDVAAGAAGVAVPVLAMLAFNARTTGAPFLFGYDLLWGKGHELGFHLAPSGVPHTPARGLQQLNVYALQLQDYLFETPIPSLLPAVIALGLSKNWRAADRYLAVSAALLAGLYFAYWHPGFYLGPRFMFALVPFFALWTARSPALVSAHVADDFTRRVLAYGLAASAVLAVATGALPRATQYADSLATERWSRRDVAARAGVHDALVFVRESWEADLVGRMWKLGILATNSESIYRSVDACRLDQAITQLEQQPPDSQHATATLLSLRADSADLETIDAGPGIQLRRDPRLHYSPHCEARLADTRAGVLPLAPLLVLEDGNIYARDLQARDTVLIAAYPHRAIYLLRPTSDAPTAMPAFVPITRDSLAHAL